MNFFPIDYWIFFYIYKCLQNHQIFLNLIPIVSFTLCFSFVQISRRILDEKSILSMLFMDNLSFKSWNSEGRGLKSYLHLCLVLQPFFGVNWMMGVVAIENAYHWSSPSTYLILVICMVSVCQ